MPKEGGFGAKAPTSEGGIASEWYQLVMLRPSLAFAFVAAAACGGSSGSTSESGVQLSQLSTPCGTTVPCPSGLACSESGCALVGCPGPGPGAQYGCPSGALCVDGKDFPTYFNGQNFCLRACAEAPQCGPAQKCNDRREGGICRPSENPK
jgi:hypothetical protein